MHYKVREMRILLMNDYTFMVGGTEKYVFDLQKLLNKKGYHTSLSGSSNKNSYLSVFSRVFSIKWYLQTKKLIKLTKPDILHINSCSWLISPSPLVAAKNLNVPTVYTVHNFHHVCPKTNMIFRDQNVCTFGFGKNCIFSDCFPKTTKAKDLYNYFKLAFHRTFFKKYVDIFICPSKILVDWMKKSMEIENVVHIPNFVDVNVKNSHRESDETYLLYVGRLSKEKGLYNLLQSMKAIINTFPDVRLKIVGDGYEKQNLEKLSISLGIDKNIDFLGSVYGEKLQFIYQNCYAVVMPSLCIESFGLVGLEAMAFGKTLIASNISGISELIVEGKTGYTCRTTNHHDLTEKIMIILSNPEKTKEIGKNAKRIYRTLFTPDKHFEKLEKIYNKVLTSKNI